VTEPRDADNWAKPVETFHVDETVEGGVAPAAGIAPGEIAVIAGGRGPTKESRGVRVYTSRLEDEIWTHTLTQLAGHFGSSAPVAMEAVLIDEKRPWDQVGNIWKNSVVRTLLRRDRH